MFGGDLPSNDAFTLSLLTNDEVLAVDQHSTGNHELFAEGNQVAWVAGVPNSRDKYLALFNLDDRAPATMRVKWTQLDLSGQCAVRDLWQHKDLGNRDGDLTLNNQSSSDINGILIHSFFAPVYPRFPGMVDPQGIVRSPLIKKWGNESVSPYPWRAFSIRGFKTLEIFFCHFPDTHGICP